jgi:hypothetical protein
MRSSQIKHINAKQILLNPVLTAIRQGQLDIGTGVSMSFADQFYALAGQIRPA